MDLVPLAGMSRALNV